MTDREAIAQLRTLLKNLTNAYETHFAYGGKADPQQENFFDVVALAISALEEREERSKGCAKCSTEKEAGMPLSNEQIYKTLNPSHKFCAYCGRPLKGESNEE